MDGTKNKKDEDDVKNNFLSNLEKHKLTATDEESKKFQDVHEIVKNLDLSVLKPEFRRTAFESKKQKTKHYLQKANILVKEKDLEETAKQIDVVKQALNIMYEIQAKRFSKMLSKRDNNIRGALSSSALLECILEKGKRIPLWLGRRDESAPPLCGCIEAISDHIAQVGDFIAALVGHKDKKTWILTEVISYDPKDEKYTVDDIFEPDKAEHIVTRDEIIPLPRTRANPQTSPEALFSKNSPVLALYPQTTCFYQGVVFKKPKQPTDQYEILFEDRRFQCNYSPPTSVDQYYVLRNKYTSPAVQKRRRKRKFSKDSAKGAESESYSSNQ